MEFHMINITYVALHMRAQTEKTTFSCKDDCTLTKHTRRWTYSALRYFFLTMLEGIPFGKFYFEIAVSSRNSLLISSLMCNSEAWYNLTNTDLNLLGYKVTQEDFESTQVHPKRTISFRIKVYPYKRINQKKKNIILAIHSKARKPIHDVQILEAQIKNRRPKYWISQVMKDIQDIKLGICLDDTKLMKKVTSWG